MFIKDCIALSPQRTFEAGSFDIEHKEERKHFAIEPDYSGLIPSNLLRRMGRSVKFGVAAGKTIMAKNPSELDGIILATAYGGIDSALKFLSQIVQYEEGTLLPTNFIHASPNAVAGSLAVLSETRKYNNTHVNLGNAFENALLDVKMQMQLNNKKRILLGATEEISEYNYNIERKAGHFKIEDCSSANILNSVTKGTIAGEGSSMFLIESEKNKDCIEIRDVDVLSTTNPEEVQNKIKSILELNGLEESDIDTFILGVNGDVRVNKYYDAVIQKYSESNIYSFKNLCGEYPTASAFGLWYTHSCLKNGKFHPETTLVDKGVKPKNVLIYNTYLGDQHGFILIKA